MKLRLPKVVVRTGPISHAKLQSDHHHQQTNIQLFTSDVNKDWTCKDKDKDLIHKDQDQDFAYSYLLQIAAIAIKQQQWTQSESSQHMTVKTITLNK